MAVVEVADVEGASAVVGVLVGGGAADAEGGVGACYDYHLVFYPPVAANVAGSASSSDLIVLKWRGAMGDIRSGRVPRYAAYLGYVFEGAGVDRLDDELLAEALGAGFGGGCHAGVHEGFDKPLVLFRRHHCRCQLR